MITYSSGIIEATLDKTKKVLANNISFFVEDKEIISLIGETGSGKSIVASSIMNLLPSNVTAKDMKLVINDIDYSSGKEIKKMIGKEIVYIPQSGLESLNPSLKIDTQFNDTLRLNKIDRKLWKKVKYDTLRSVGFLNPDEILNKYSFELSGGMGQRVTIAFASISKHLLIIADEPTNGLDEKAKFKIMDLLFKTFKDASFILITHDIEIAKLSSRCLVLNKGVVIEEGKSEDILFHPHHPYTKALLDAQVENGMKETKLLRKVNSSCPFANRCEKYSSNCLEKILINEDETSKWRCNYHD